MSIFGSQVRGSNFSSQPPNLGYPEGFEGGFQPPFQNDPFGSNQGGYAVDTTYFDKFFERNFRATVNELKRINSNQFNLATLQLNPYLLKSELLFFVDVKGIHEGSIFKELEQGVCFVSSKKELSVEGFYAFKHQRKASLRPPEGFRLVGTTTFISVPNRYVSPDTSVEYVGTDMVAEGVYIQYYWVKVDKLFRAPTYAVSLATNKVKNHLGGLSLVLTNGSTLYLVVQDRSAMRNTETKNIYFVNRSFDECMAYIKDVRGFLVRMGKTFDYNLFDIQKEVDGLQTTYNLVTKELTPTMTRDEGLFEMSLADEGI